MEGLDKFTLQKEIEVRWGDMDVFKHVNNTVYLKWVECARVDYLIKNVTGIFGKKKLGPILARQDCRYISPVTFPDTVIVAFKVDEILEDRLLCQSRIYSTKNKKLSALVYNTVMAYDFEKLCKASIPENWVNNITSYESHF